jgi:hypothetical protein
LKKLIKIRVIATSKLATFDHELETLKANRHMHDPADFPREQAAALRGSVGVFAQLGSLRTPIAHDGANHGLVSRRNRGDRLDHRSLLENGRHSLQHLVE